MQPLRFLAEAGLSAHAGSIYEAGLPPCRLLVLHRVALDPVTQRVIQLARSYGASILYDTDDFLAGPVKTDWDPKIAAALEEADLVSVSGRDLAAKVAQLGKETVIVRAKLSRMIFAAAERAANRSAHREAVVIGYFSGSAHHDADFEMIAPALARILRKYPKTRLALGGKLSVGEGFNGLADRVTFAPFRPYAEFVELLGEIDINLAPLDLTSPLAQARSDLKYIEASAFGVPTIASPSTAYLDAIEDGKTGLIANDDAWQEKLELLIESRDRRKQIGAAARTFVTREASPDAGRKEWLDLFERLKPTAFRGGHWKNLSQRWGLHLTQRTRAGRGNLRIALGCLPVRGNDPNAVQ
ncbi:MAG: glycosyltransferase [Pseudomonadota bacterium]